MTDKPMTLREKCLTSDTLTRLSCEEGQCEWGPWRKVRGKDRIWQSKCGKCGQSHFAEGKDKS